MTLAHCGMWTGGEAAKAFRICEKNLPMRHQDMNLVHLSFGLWAVIEFVKQFLSAKLKGRIFSLADDDKMAEKFDYNMLPLEFGGNILKPASQNENRFIIIKAYLSLRRNSIKWDDAGLAAGAAEKQGSTLVSGRDERPSLGGDGRGGGDGEKRRGRRCKKKEARVRIQSLEFDPRDEDMKIILWLSQPNISDCRDYLAKLALKYGSRYM